MNILKSSFVQCSLFLFFLFPQFIWSQYAKNPIIWADVPDPSMIRVDDTYYMVSTTMHLSPGIPIMKSKNLVDWELVNYAYDRLIENDKINLNNGQNAYGKGSWASSIAFHNGIFYIHTFSYTTGKSHIYQTTDIENGSFTSITLSSLSHDASLFFDGDRVYLAYGHDDITLRELNSDLSDYKAGSTAKVIISNASGVAGSNMILTAEGTQMFKVNGWYYIMNICWPSRSGRTVIIHRSQNILGPYEGRVALNDQGVAQGGLISTPDNQWYSYLFQDHGAVGRVPYLVPIQWENNWPVFSNVPSQLPIIKQKSDLSNIVSSDHFESLNDKNNGLKLAWQWNHNPVNNYWSLTQRPGYLRITNDRIDNDFLSTHNSLSQRSFGPQSYGTIAIETQGMKDGDFAGIAAQQYDYGMVGVKKVGASKSIFMINATNSIPVEMATVPFNQDRVHLRINMDFRNRTDKATFFYSLDSLNWIKIGNTLTMKYSLEHFMGYRFSLFNFATKSSGGFVDFDYYQVNDYPFEEDRLSPHIVPGVVQAEEYTNMSGILSETDDLGEKNIGWINDGDWVEYLISVEQAGVYQLKFNLATGADSNSTISILDHQNVSKGLLEVSTSKSNGWHDWYVDSTRITLVKGIQVLKLRFNGVSDYLLNIDDIEFTYLDSLSDDVVTLIDNKPEYEQVPLSAKGYRIDLYSTDGVRHFSTKINLSDVNTLERLISEKIQAPKGVYIAIIRNGDQLVSQKRIQINSN